MHTETTKKTYAILPGPEMGVVPPEYLETLAAVARKYDIPFLKITSAQRLAMAGHAEESAEPKGIHYIQACPGAPWCKYGRRDSLELARKLEEACLAMDLPAKTKVGVSGCPMNCCESYVRDLGIFAKKNGWTLVFGGNGGSNPRLGDMVAEDLSDDEVVELAGRCLRFYGEKARNRERSARFMERTGIEVLQEAVLL